MSDMTHAEIATHIEGIARDLLQFDHPSADEAARLLLAMAVLFTDQVSPERRSREAPN
ncbi:MAG: hypothetical protein AAGN82_22775 [Myxococcota bacterium]